MMSPSAVAARTPRTFAGPDPITVSLGAIPVPVGVPVALSPALRGAVGGPAGTTPDVPGAAAARQEP